MPQSAWCWLPRASLEYTYPSQRDSQTKNQSRLLIGYYCFHAGTKLDGDTIVTNGGRVLGITAKGRDLKEARKNAYEATEWISFANKYMRNDIGKAIDEA